MFFLYSANSEHPKKLHIIFLKTAFNTHSLKRPQLVVFHQSQQIRLQEQCQNRSKGSLLFKYFILQLILGRVFTDEAVRRQMRSQLKITQPAMSHLACNSLVNPDEPRSIIPLNKEHARYGVAEVP